MIFDYNPILLKRRFTAILWSHKNSVSKVTVTKTHLDKYTDERKRNEYKSNK